MLQQDPASVVAATKTPPLTYKAFEKAIDKLGPAPLPVADPPASLSGPKQGAPHTEGTAVPSLEDIGYLATNTSPFKVVGLVWCFVS